jgi:hypothetical protein
VEIRENVEQLDVRASTPDVVAFRRTKGDVGNPCHVTGGFCREKILPKKPRNPRENGIAAFSKPKKTPKLACCAGGK